MERRTALRSIAVLLGMVAALDGRRVTAGTIAPELEQVLQQTPPTQKVQAAIPMTAQANPDEVGGSLGTADERHAAIVAALKTMALATQDVPGCGRPGLVTELEQAGSAQADAPRRHWVVNAVVVNATPALIRSVATRGDVGELQFAGVLATEAPPATAAGAAWNVSRVGAPAAWALGFTGTGGILAAIDTGGDPAHPDLGPNLLRDPGNQPVWHDAVAGQASPYDDDGHGTHLLGVAAGRNGYGVAPDARWMACKAFTRNGTTLTTTRARILECAEWIKNPLHPDLEDAAAPVPGYRPDAVLIDLLVSAAGYCDPLLHDVIRGWRAAGILPVFSVGDHPDVAPVGAVPSPANDPAVFSVGAADQSDAILPATYRGLAFCPGPLRNAPRLVAPGVDVTAPWPGGQYRTRGGSDVAAAHVAGAVALVRGARPDLRRVPVDVLDTALERTGAPAAAGQRRLDVLAAVTLEDGVFVGQEPPPSPLTTGQTVTVTVSLQNTGVTSWTQGAHRLRYVGAPSSPWGIGEVDLPVERVLPGEEVAITFAVTAPATPDPVGGYPFEWQVCAASCFGARSTRVLVPVVGVDGATFVSQTVPCLGPGQSGTATVTFRNTGTNPWTHPDYALGKLGTYSDPQVVGLAPGESVPPTASRTFSFSVTGPFPTGWYTFQRRMQRGGTPIGEAGPAHLVDTNFCTPSSAAVSATFAPGELRVGQSSSALVWMRNDGLTTWRTGYCLHVHSANGTRAALASTPTIPVCLSGFTTVPPTQIRLFTAPLVAQAEYGRWPLSATMYDDFGRSFGATWQTTIGIPRDHPGSGEFEMEQGANNWFYRYYSGATNAWKKMTWNVAGHWQGSGTLQTIHPTTAHPGGSNAVGRFWKSPLHGWIRASASVQDLDAGCGDGVVVRLRKNTTLVREWTIPNGGTASISDEICVEPDDTVRFIVAAGGNNGCDTTQLDPLIQVLPPAHPATGPVPGGGTSSNPAIEPAGVLP